MLLRCGGRVKLRHKEGRGAETLLDAECRAARAVLYAHVSTEEQNNGFSISDQLRTLHDHARRQGIEIVEECVDAGYPALAALSKVREEAEEGGGRGGGRGPDRALREVRRP